MNVKEDLDGVSSFATSKQKKFLAKILRNITGTLKAFTTL